MVEHSSCPADPGLAWLGLALFGVPKPRYEHAFSMTLRQKQLSPISSFAQLLLSIDFFV